MERLFEKASKMADQAEILCVQRQLTSISSYFYQEMEILNQDTKEISLRVIKNGKIGTATGNLESDPDKIVEAALQAASYGASVSFSFPSEDNPDAGGKIYDPKLATLTESDMAENAKKILDKTYKAAPDMPVNLYIERDFKTVTILNTSGKKSTYQTTVYTISLLHMFEKSKEGINKDMVNCRYYEFPDEKIEELVKEYERTQHTYINLHSGRYPVIFRPSATWSLLYRILVGVNGQNYVKGITPLKEKLGERLFGENITIIDDPTLAWAPCSVPFDDEGVTTFKKPIVEKGILKNFIFDLDSGARSQKRSTGNGFKHSMWEKTIEISPNPRFSNLVMSPGEWDYNDMLKDMKEGIVVNDVIGFHSANLLQGEFSMGVGMGFYVKDGEIKGRATNAMVAGNIYDDFNKIKGLGSELEHNSLGYTPAIYFSDMSVAGA